MSEPTRREQPAQWPATQAKQPGIIDLDQVETTSGLDSLTEATVKFEAPSAREARERREFSDQAHKHRIDLIKITLASILLLGFFGLGVYLFAVKPRATEAQKTYATAILTSIVSGGIGYAFGKQGGSKPDKE